MVREGTTELSEEQLDIALLSDDLWRDLSGE
jgi:hypothetical protein